MCNAMKEITEEAHQKGMAEGIAKGIAKGELNANAAVAMKMLADNFSPDKIAEYTGLSLAKIQELAGNMPS